MTNVRICDVRFPSWQLRRRSQSLDTMRGTTATDHLLAVVRTQKHTNKSNCRHGDNSIIGCVSTQYSEHTLPVAVPTLVQCCASVGDAGTALSRRWTDESPFSGTRRNWIWPLWDGRQAWRFRLAPLASDANYPYGERVCTGELSMVPAQSSGSHQIPNDP